MKYTGLIIKEIEKIYMTQIKLKVGMMGLYYQNLNLVMVILRHAEIAID